MITSPNWRSSHAILAPASSPSGQAPNQRRAHESMIASSSPSSRPCNSARASRWPIGFRANIVLSARACPTPGPFILWKYQRGILDAVDDPSIWHVSVIKAARLGYTKTIMGALGHFAANAPCPAMLLVPTEDDANRLARDEVGADVCRKSPALQGLLSSRQGPGDRDSLTAKYFSNGGSLKIPAARAPRNLRSHDVKILLDG